MTIEEADVKASTAFLFRTRTSLYSVNTEPVKVRNSEEEQSWFRFETPYGTEDLKISENSSSEEQ